jgi:hypothetical protein
MPLRPTVEQRGDPVRPTLRLRCADHIARRAVFDAVALAPWGSPFVAHVRKHETAFAGLPAYAHEALLRAYLQGAAYRPLTEDALRIYMEPWQGTMGQAAFYRQIAQMDQRHTDEVEVLYRPLDCRVTVLWGERDDWIPIAKGEALASLISAQPLTQLARRDTLSRKTHRKRLWPQCWPDVSEDLLAPPRPKSSLDSTSNIGRKSTVEVSRLSPVSRR